MLKPTVAFKVPVAFFVFNRPETTSRVFEVIRRVQPTQLFVIADGPRSNRSGEQDLCDEVRHIFKNVDWPCELKLRFLDENLGCRRGVTEGINWVFEQVDQAIILEDDCVPDLSFFPFCEELLERYADDPNIGMVSGDNFQNGVYKTADSYYFSRFCHIWGWATWRRAWKKMDVNMTTWPEIRKTKWLAETIGRGPQKHFWSTWFDDAFRGDAGAMKTWDVAWTYSCWRHEMRCIIPELNLVKNIGFGINSTHTREGSKWETMYASTILFPLRHPDRKSCFVLADTYTGIKQYYGSSLAQRILCTLRLPFRLSTLVWIRCLFPKPHRRAVDIF